MFCGSCGAELPGAVAFCGQCGQPAGGGANATAPVTAAAPAASSFSYQSAPYAPGVAPKKGMSGLAKFLIFVAVLFVLIIAGLAGAGYYAYHRVREKVAEFTQPKVESTGPSLAGKSGCDFLDKDEFHSITGIRIVETVPSTSMNQLSCQYYVKAVPPEAQTPVLNPDDLKDPQKALEALRSSINRSKQNAPILTVTIETSHPNIMLFGSKVASGVTGAQTVAIQGLGDESYIDSVGTMLVARKGSRAVMLTMHLLPHAKQNAPVIARRILEQM